jgi:hypothetical protein
MQSHWANAAPYYRCRFPAEYAIANRIEHPLNVCLREDAILGHVDRWLAREFAPHRLSRTIDDLVAAQEMGVSHAGNREEAAREIAECDRKLAQYRVALDTARNSATIAGWIAGTEARRAQHEVAMRRRTIHTRITKDQVKAMIDELGAMPAVLRTADPGDKSDIYQHLGLRLTYHPSSQTVRAIIPAEHWFFESVRGSNAPKNQCVLSGEFAVGSRS